MTKRLALYFALLFFLGLVTGGVIGVAATKRQITKPLDFQGIVSSVQKELATKLELDPDQRKKVDGLVVRSVERIKKIYFDTYRRIDEVIVDGQEELTAELRPGQIEKLGTLAKSREEFVRKHNPLEPQK